MERINEIYPLLTWSNIYDKEDHFITFLLYQEGKSIDLISKIRNISEEIVKEHIIQSKSKLKFKKNTISDQEFVSLLAGTKAEREKYLDCLDIDGRRALAQYLLKKIPLIENAEDKMIALWIAGELQDKSLLPLLHHSIDHKHGGIRRMVCSALGKIASEESIDVLHRALQDVKPQVRQYAAKALQNIGNEKTIRRLKGLLNNPKELGYVQRSYRQTIEVLENKLRKD